MANKRGGTLYTGVTSALVQRADQHSHGLLPGFTARYHCTRLVWFELHDTMEAAIMRKSKSKPVRGAGR
jgi:putative endonuclease